MGRRRTSFACVTAVAWILAPGFAAALDPPHNEVNGINCTIGCHMPHNAPGGTITKVAGNPNLCMSCHNPTGLASNRPFADSDQAFPGVTGISHRFDSGPSGHVETALTNTSTGSAASSGTFTGRIENIYTITITLAGNLGVAVFSWDDGGGNSGSATTGVDVPISEGLLLTFADGGTAPSFVLNDTWTLYVRTDLRLPDPNDPFERAMSLRIMNNKVVCSTCHNQHSQEKTPFDPTAPPFTGAGSGWGRHYQRADNDVNQMCHICHSARNVQALGQGSHPVGIPVPGTGFFQQPADLPLTAAGFVECLTCHNPHFNDSGGANGGDGDGYILNLAIGDLCYNCHTLADRDTASHFNLTTGLLWPGGQYGSSFPAHNPDKRGLCVNCHWPHGWPDDQDPPADYPRFWVERYDTQSDGTDPDDAEDLCFTCHDGSPAGSDIRGDFNKGVNGAVIFHHPVKDSEQTAGRSVECINCHNPHKATAADKHKGVDGIDLNGVPIGQGTANPVDIVQYELCFKCHGDTFNATRPNTTNKRLDFQPTNSAFHPVTATGRNQSANLNQQLVGGLLTSSTIVCTDCHNSDATADAQGPASNSSASTKGPHGSVNGTIRRGNYFTGLLGPTSFNANNFELCFLCHDVNRLVLDRRRDDGARTNFYDDINGRDNLHWVHLEDRIDKSRAVCKNCHFNIHSNVTANNTQYNINGVTTDSPPDGVHTHLVNFSPDILPIGGRAKPEWWFDTSSRERRCYLSCHGETMNGLQYRPNQGDDNPTVP